MRSWDPEAKSWKRVGVVRVSSIFSLNQLSLRSPPFIPQGTFVVHIGLLNLQGGQALFHNQPTNMNFRIVPHPSHQACSFAYKRWGQVREFPMKLHHRGRSSVEAPFLLAGMQLSYLTLASVPSP